jgi:histidyl-tRNA synthetase
MSEKFKMQPVRGVRDILGNEIKSFNKIVDAARSLSGLYNYQEIALPIFEFTEIFHRTLGETSDVVSKETYTFIDRDTTSITLRPEFTAGIVRSVISNGLTQSLPIRYFSYGPVFRHERPQKARYRQFNQINIENIGIADYTADVETIVLATQILKSIGVYDKVRLEFSSIGDPASRAKYRELLVSYFSKYMSDLSEDSKNRLEKNPLRILDSKDEGDKKLVAGAPSIYESLNDDSMRRFESIQNSLSELGVEYKLNPKLVRGLDYYTHTVFEFITDSLGSQGTVLAGGRYDGLFETMGGPSIPAVGFASGIERLCELMSATQDNGELICLIPVGESALSYAPVLAQKLRNQGKRVDYWYHNNVGKQIQKADKMGASYVVVFGDNELSSQKFQMKNMKTGEFSDLA